MTSLKYLQHLRVYFIKKLNNNDLVYISGGRRQLNTYKSAQATTLN